MELIITYPWFPNRWLHVMSTTTLFTVFCSIWLKKRALPCTCLLFYCSELLVFSLRKSSYCIMYMLTNDCLPYFFIWRARVTEETPKLYYNGWTYTSVLTCFLHVGVIYGGTSLVCPANFLYIMITQYVYMYTFKVWNEILVK
jgi:hypothetical protein